MKYFIQFEGNEKLILKIIIALFLIIVALLSKIAFTERPVYVEVDYTLWQEKK